MAPVKLTDKDIDYLVRLVATEADHKLVWSHPEEYSAQVHGIVDTVLNRVASGKWGDTVESVANAKRQFSKIAGPKSVDPYGSVDKVPDSAIPAFLPSIVTSWVTARATGTPSSIGGNLNYANPLFSDASNLGWINALDGPKLGYGDSTHYHGTVSGLKPVEAEVYWDGATPPTPVNKPQTISRAQERGGSDADLVIQLKQRLDEQRASLPQETRDVLSDLRDRLRPTVELARQLKSPAPGIDVTPRLEQSNGEVSGIEDRRPSLDWGPSGVPGAGAFQDSFFVGGMGSLLDGGIPPSMSNPELPSLSIGVMPLEVKPIPPKVTVAPPLPRPRPAVEQPPVPLDRPQTTAPQTAVMPNGKTVTVGKAYTIGDQTYIGGVDKNGVGTLNKVPHTLLDEATPGTIAGGLVKSGMADAIGAAVDDIGAQTAAAAPLVVEGVQQAAGNLADTVGGFFGNLFGGKTPAPVNVNSLEARDERKPVTTAPIIQTVVAGRPDAPIGSMPAAKPGMTLHPFDPSINTPRANPDGSYSTEITRTVQLADGSWGNVPSLWWSGGSTVRDFSSMTDDQLAGLATRYEQQTGKKFPRFGNLSAAEAAASSRSEAGGGTQGLITSAPALSANANLSQARSEQAIQRTAPVIPKASLTAPGAGITPAQKAAIAAYTPKTVTVRNPAYDEWVAKYEDGSQVQTAPTGGLITANQLAAISGSGAPVPATKAPAPPPKTIQVQQTLPGVVPNAQPQPRAQTPDTIAQDMLVSAITMLTGSDVAGDFARSVMGGLNNGGKRTGSTATGTGPNGYTYQNGVNLGYSTAEKARREAEGKAIGEANRKSAGPSYSFSGENNSFMPKSYQDSLRQQTGY